MTTTKHAYPRPVRALTSALLALVAGAVALPLGACASGERSKSGRAAWEGAPRVQGRAIVALGDGDLHAGMFYDYYLFGEDNDASQRARDTLTLVRLPLPDPGDSAAQADVAQIEVTNSVIGPPRAAAMDLDGRFLLVLETRGPAPAGARVFTDLPPGGTLTLVDTSSPFEGGTDPMERGVRILSTINVGPGMSSVALHPDGNVAVVSGPGSLEALFVRIHEGELRAAERFRLAGLPRGDLARPATIAFDPTGRYLAVTAIGADMVAFYEYHDDGEQVYIRQWGAPTYVGNYPYTGQWTPDGRHFVTTDLRWGEPSSPAIVDAPAGRISVIRVADTMGEDALHERIAIADVGVSPEGIAIHQAGDLIVTANIRGSFIPEGDDRRTDGGSLTLLSFDRNRERLTVLGEYDTGVAPQGLAFDTTGEHLLVTDFEDGSVQVWRVVRGRETSLVFTGVIVRMDAGTHWVGVLP